MQRAKVMFSKSDTFYAPFQPRQAEGEKNKSVVISGITPQLMQELERVRRMTDRKRERDRKTDSKAEIYV